MLAVVATFDYHRVVDFGPACSIWLKWGPTVVKPTSPVYIMDPTMLPHFGAARNWSILINDWILLHRPAERRVLPVEFNMYHPIRWGWVPMWKEGEPVSRYFNGEITPCGVITEIRNKHRTIKTSEDNLEFERVFQTSIWKCEVWALVQGHRHHRNWRMK